MLSTEQEEIFKKKPQKKEHASILHKHQQQCMSPFRYAMSLIWVQN